MGSAVPPATDAVSPFCSHYLFCRENKDFFSPFFWYHVDRWGIFFKMESSYHLNPVFSFTNLTYFRELALFVLILRNGHWDLAAL